ncbi:family 78 glycoside hydrolase catalytic domain [Dorea acetigenes]|uniref:alpha-L-rhamnosidase n=1 Tax=Dorea acetigenes TaxID=2981787 RepID=A0ABT2RNX6_9FIRM|nr:family 78 glycoside hydrolase catalytic domain [Dorea acetigenes]MCU6687080.1 family 78 glycoside hydrolase catalytic domain [Dorea acetigenes]SCJ25116.1 Endoglucanase precursor [uncultured Clostridium sp.]
MKQQWKRAAAFFLSICLLFSVMPVTASAAVSDDVRISISDMTTEYMANPIGIETDSVHFGWKLESNGIGTKQTAYQIQVTESGTSKAVWDSGKVENDKSVGISYGGEALAEGTAYDWTVKVWTETGSEVQSGTASFETGVTNQQAWKNAAFIRMNKSSAAPVFRTEQKLDGKVESARLYITAIGAYQAYVNGSRAGVQEDGETVYHHMNPGYGNRNISMGYQAYDVTSMLEEQDTAVVSVIGGTGWNDGNGGTNIGATSAQPAVKAMLRIRYADDTVKDIVTNTTDWKGTLDSGITANGVYYGEDYDARIAEELGDFTKAGYDDSAWVNSLTEGNDTQTPVIHQEFAAQENVKYAQLVVEEIGPGTKGDNENRLQMMELELKDSQGNNVVSGLAPKVSNTFTWGTQWTESNLTDGDYGIDSDRGYSSEQVASGQTSFTLETPITIEFAFDSAVSVESLDIYPRIKGEPISGNECVNYPKKYSLKVSENGTDWTTVDTYQVDSLRNTVSYPETDSEGVYSEADFGEVTAQDVRVAVYAVGPAVMEDNENRLQIMELELLDSAEKNVAAGVTPTISRNFESAPQWSAANLTDGDYGLKNNAGFTTEILDYGNEVLDMEDNPITIDFHFNQAVTFSGMKLYARTDKESIYYGVCPNYAKIYSIQTSSDGGKTWKDIDGASKLDAGTLKNTVLSGKTAMSTTTYSGEIRAQAATPGKIIDKFSKEPVSCVLYTGQAANSSLAGGEVNVDKYYAYEEPEDALYAGKYEAVSEGENILGDGITLKKGQTMIVNLGQNMTAIPEVEFAAERGTRLTMRFAEMLNDGSASGNGATQADGPKGSIYQKSLRNARSAVKYTFAGDGKEHYQTTMSFFGYQYIEFTATDDVTIYSVKSKALSSITEQTGNIETNNANVNKLFSNTLYGQMSNYFTTSTDCPQRDERQAWSGDTQAFAQTAVYNFNSVAFLNEIQDILSENTLIKGYTPSVFDDMNGYFSTWAAGWSDVEIIDPWVLYSQTGDTSVLEENWDAMVHYMDYMKAHERGANQAPIDLGADRNYGDWLSFQGTSVEVISDYYYGYMAQLMAKIAGVLGNTEKQAAYEQQFEDIKETFLKTHVTFNDGNLVIKSGTGDMQRYQFMWWAGKGGTWEDNSQTALLWMLKLGFYDSDEMRDAAKELLIENIKNENPAAGSIRANYGKNTLAVGFLGSNVITPVLSDIGSSDVSYDLLLQDEQPSWLFEVKAGATTIWERWNSYTPGVGFGDSEMNSFNHYAYGSVVEWMYRYMAGIAADEENPGFKNIILQPTPDTGEKYNDEERIHSVDASYESYYGKIESQWKSTDGELTSYHTVIPANTTAVLYLPVKENALDGFEALTGMSYEGMEEHNGLETAKFVLESGGYDFSVKDGKLTAVYAEGYVGQEDGDDPVVVESITVTAPTKTEYTAGEELNLDGMKVTAKYSDDTTKDIAVTDCKVSGYDKNKTGEQTVTVTYEGKIATFKVTVKEAAKPNDTDKKKLEAAIKNAVPDTKKDHYSEASWAAYEEALKKAEEVFADTAATQKEIDDAAAALDEAAKALQWKKLPYEDVVENDWFYDEVAYNYYEGTMTGMDDTHFAPYTTLVRAQFATILYRLNGEPKVEYEAKFPDVPDGQFYSKAVTWAAETEVVTGYTDSGYFGTNDPITREQMVTMMYRYANYKKYKSEKPTDISAFTDADKVTEFAEDAMKWAVGNGIIAGKENEDGSYRLDPQGGTSRAECAIIIQRFMEKFEK